MMLELSQPQEPLTEREQVVLRLIADGLSNRQIGERLSLTLHTVKWYVKQIFTKLQVRRRTQAVAVAQSIGLLDSSVATPVSLLSNLPVAITPFIGRTEELDALADLLNQTNTRLVTITGLGGIGKSRLAIEAVSRHRPTISTQSCFIPLDGVRSRAALVQAIAAAIGYQFSGALDLEQQLLVDLRRQRGLLLLFDSFEHLLDSTDLVSHILTTSAGVKVLVTSRERLNIHGETVFAVRGLDYQPVDGQQCSAVRLFRQSTLCVQTAFKPTPTDLVYIEQICWLVEGMPLAIELAASWMDVLTPDRILAAMKESLTILKSQLRDIPDRHLSIRAVFAYSWERLTQEERATLKKLSVFEGGFDRAAAEQVAGATIFGLSGLVDKSLVSRVGANRYKMHELLRQFAAERLNTTPEELQQTLDQHCRYYATLLHQFEQESKTNFASTSSNLLKTQVDLDNVMAAWRRARKTPLIFEIGKLAYFVSLFYEFFGLSREGQETFGDALQQLTKQLEQVSPIILMRVLTHYGWFCQSQYELDRAKDALEKALNQSSTLDDSHNADTGLMCAFLGWVVHLLGHSTRAWTLVEQGVKLCQGADFQLGHLISLHMLGEIEYDAGHYRLAHGYHQQVLMQFESSQFHTLLTLSFLGFSCMALEDYSEASKHFHNMLTLLKTFPNMLSGLLVLSAIAAIYGQKGQVEHAVRYALIVLNHPQTGSYARHKAENVLKQFQPQVEKEVFRDLKEEVARGHLPNFPLEPDFRLDAETIDHLEALLDGALHF